VVRTGIAPETDKGVGFFGFGHEGDYIREEYE
jgi:hypothetical protein